MEQDVQCLFYYVLLIFFVVFCVCQHEVIITSKKIEKGNFGRNIFRNFALIYDHNRT